MLMLLVLLELSHMLMAALGITKTGTKAWHRIARRRRKAC